MSRSSQNFRLRRPQTVLQRNIKESQILCSFWPSQGETLCFWLVFSSNKAFEQRLLSFGRETKKKLNLRKCLKNKEENKSNFFVTFSKSKSWVHASGKVLSSKWKCLKKNRHRQKRKYFYNNKKSNVESFFVLTASSILLTLMLLVLVATSKRGFRAHKKTMRKWALFEKETNAFFFVAKQKKTLWSSLFVNKVVFSLFFWAKNWKVALH